ncbi:hypothetical protein V8C86DRAFT_797444 [Haematococcus lacustris]
MQALHERTRDPRPSIGASDAPPDAPTRGLTTLAGANLAGLDRLGLSASHARLPSMRMASSAYTFELDLDEIISPDTRAAVRRTLAMNDMIRQHEAAMKKYAAARRKQEAIQDMLRARGVITRNSAANASPAALKIATGYSTRATTPGGDTPGTAQQQQQRARNEALTGRSAGQGDRKESRSLGGEAAGAHAFVRHVLAAVASRPAEEDEQPVSPPPLLLLPPHVAALRGAKFSAGQEQGGQERRLSSEGGGAQQEEQEAEEGAQGVVGTDTQWQQGIQRRLQLVSHPPSPSHPPTYPRGPSTGLAGSSHATRSRRASLRCLQADQDLGQWVQGLAGLLAQEAGPACRAPLTPSLLMACMDKCGSDDDIGQPTSPIARLQLPAVAATAPCAAGGQPHTPQALPLPLPSSPWAQQQCGQEGQQPDPEARPLQEAGGQAVGSGAEPGCAHSPPQPPPLLLPPLPAPRPPPSLSPNKGPPQALGVSSTPATPTTWKGGHQQEQQQEGRREQQGGAPTSLAGRAGDVPTLRLQEEQANRYMLAPLPLGIQVLGLMAAQAQGLDRVAPVPSHPPLGLGAPTPHPQPRSPAGPALPACLPLPQPLHLLLAPSDCLPPPDPPLLAAQHLREMERRRQQPSLQGPGVGAAVAPLSRPPSTAQVPGPDAPGQQRLGSGSNQDACNAAAAGAQAAAAVAAAESRRQRRAERHARRAAAAAAAQEPAATWSSAWVRTPHSPPGLARGGAASAPGPMPANLSLAWLHGDRVPKEASRPGWAMASPPSHSQGWGLAGGSSLGRSGPLGGREEQQLWGALQQARRSLPARASNGSLQGPPPALATWLASAAPRPVISAGAVLEGGRGQGWGSGVPPMPDPRLPGFQLLARQHQGRGKAHTLPDTFKPRPVVSSCSNGAA